MPKYRRLDATHVLYNFGQARLLMHLFYPVVDNPTPVQFWKTRVAYQLFWKGELLFEGEDYDPSHVYEWCSLSSALCLMVFLTTRPGDTDPEYFDKYTEKQLAWAKSHEAETLSCLIHNLEEREDKKSRR